MFAAKLVEGGKFRCKYVEISFLGYKLSSVCNRSLVYLLLCM